MRARGLMPSCCARLSLITITAAAPSLSGHALPAVTVARSPSCPSRTGLSVASFSRSFRDGGSRRCRPLAARSRYRGDLLSEETWFSERLPRVVGKGLRIRLAPREKSPCAARRFLAVCSIVMYTSASTVAELPVASIGRHQLRHPLFSRPKTSGSWCFPSHRPCPMRNGSRIRTPAATNTSPSPALIACAAIRIVCNDEEQ